jgi:hypothetical protein
MSNVGIVLPLEMELEIYPMPCAPECSVALAWISSSTSEEEPFQGLQYELLLYPIFPSISYAEKKRTSSPRHSNFDNNPCFSYSSVNRIWIYSVSSRSRKSDYRKHYANTSTKSSNM